MRLSKLWRAVLYYARENRLARLVEQDEVAAPSVAVWIASGQSNSEIAGSTGAPPTGWSEDSGIKIWNGSAFVTYQPGSGVASLNDGVPTAGWGALANAAKAFRAANPTRELRIIHNAKGSTAISAWTKPDGVLWVPTTGIIDDALAALSSEDYAVELVWWMQGEADAAATTGLTYSTALTTLITNMRSDWGVPATCKIVVGRTYRPAAQYIEYVRDQQAEVALADSYVYLLNCDSFPNDGLHYTDVGYEQMGTALGQVVTGALGDYSSSVPSSPTIATSSSISAAENSTSVATLTADKPFVAASIVGGADADEFSITTPGGILTFVVPPDYETPTDTDTNNVYVVTVEVEDGRGNTSSKTLNVTVTDVEEGVYGVAEADAIETQAVALGATATTTNNTAWYNAVEDFIAAEKNAGRWASKIQAMWVLAAPEFAAARVNWKSPGTYDCNTPTTMGTFTAKVGYAGNGINSQPNLVPAGLNPSTFVADRNNHGIAFRNSTAGTTGLLQIGNTGVGGPAFRRGRAQLGSGNANYTAADTTGFQAAIRQNSSTAIRIYKNDGAFQTSVAITDTALTQTSSAFPAASDAVLNAVIYLAGNWSDADIDGLRDNLETLLTAIAAS